MIADKINGKSDPIFGKNMEEMNNFFSHGVNVANYKAAQELGKRPEYANVPLDVRFKAMDATMPAGDKKPTYSSVDQYITDAMAGKIGEGAKVDNAAPATQAQVPAATPVTPSVTPAAKETNVAPAKSETPYTGPYEHGAGAGYERYTATSPIKEPDDKFKTPVPEMPTDTIQGRIAAQKTAEIQAQRQRSLVEVNEKIKQAQNDYEIAGSVGRDPELISQRKNALDALISQRNELSEPISKEAVTADVAKAQAGQAPVSDMKSPIQAPVPPLETPSPIAAPVTPQAKEAAPTPVAQTAPISSGQSSAPFDVISSFISTLPREEQAEASRRAAEMLDVRTKFDIAIIDECFMLQDPSRGKNWLRAIMEIHAIVKPNE